MTASSSKASFPFKESVWKNFGTKTDNPSSVPININPSELISIVFISLEINPSLFEIVSFTSLLNRITPPPKVPIKTSPFIPSSIS